MQNQQIDPSRITGWGIDADPKNDPTYPMRDRSRDDNGGMNWRRPPQQPRSVEVLQSIERNDATAVFGTSVPPSGLSGAIRRVAFRYSESQWAHWLMLMAADRVNVFEGVLQDIGRGSVPNIPSEMGMRSELAHNRVGLTNKLVVSGIAAGLGLFVVTRMLRSGPRDTYRGIRKR